MPFGVAPRGNENLIVSGSETNITEDFGPARDIEGLLMGESGYQFLTVTTFRAR